MREKLHASPDQADNGFAGDESRGGKYTGVFDPGPLGFIEAAFGGEGIADATDDAADENGEGRFKRQIHSDSDQHGTPHLQHDHRNTHEDADYDQGPGHVAADDALREGGHKAGLGRGKFAISKADTAGADVALLEQEKGPVHDERSNHDGDQLGDLDIAGGATQDSRL